ncbi:glycine cleavage system aminomethyltransferase GcvT [Sneathiella sp. HT1-7]|uniref:glycine cleavage system aminomethyltransferase GcvT n=1 Tax=Sneathiella sp. HT1-7 TaxID=2887192 RepID=UPI001D140370|nr:glycine cleavage system aminomethyltransferase GcvT [Sneathiella sp. HT1-7]MCC3303405.1 glycine cleavage system aminomethyltransferase GcvT [Sneathiella sp. HT1-7]
MSETSSTKKTVLYNLHVELGAKMVPFAGYDMPVQYPAGILNEHLHTREAAGLFDVSHMGQVVISGENPARAIEALIPGDIQALSAGEMRYSFLTNDQGGILDDLIVTRRENDLFVVVNAACKEQDIALLTGGLAGKAEVTELTDRALVALQGPKAVDVLARYAPEVVAMSFMNYREVEIDGVPCFVTRSGYTGEDGFEISIPNDQAEEICRKLLDETEVMPIGLGARDSLRLEAGLCLYGHDLNEVTTPISAGLIWAISKRRRIEGGFPGADIIQADIANNPAMKRVGILPEGRAPAREHTVITNEAGETIGEITSGGFSPSLGIPIAMGYVPLDFSAVGTKINLLVRGKSRPAVVAKMPFVEQRYYRG